MNVLFLTSFKVSPTQGGTERATISVATGLRELYGWHCFSAYIVDAATARAECFDAEYCVGGKGRLNALRDIIVDNDVDFVVVQGIFELVKPLRAMTRDLKCMTVVAHHFQPGWETHFMTFDDYVGQWKKSPDPLRWCKRGVDLLLYPILRARYLHKLPAEYHEAYACADAVVLLSKNHVRPFMQFGHIDDERKFHVIPNSLSFPTFLPKEKINNKKNVALIVSRLDDPPKRISLAIKIWNAVKQHKEAEDWKLNIVGHGPYMHAYQQLIKKLGTPDVYLLGRQAPNRFYEESSIFMMTSKSEGWGLTVTEAQQMGVVPIAFNSYASLCDIITDGDNGLVIPECDAAQYAEKLLWLMSHVPERRRLAAQAIDSAHRYENSKIVELWHALFKQLKDKK